MSRMKLHASYIVTGKREGWQDWQRRAPVAHSLTQSSPSPSATRHWLPFYLSGIPFLSVFSSPKFYVSFKD